MHRRSILLILTASLAIALAGCSGEERSADSAASMPSERSKPLSVHGTSATQWAAWDPGLAKAKAQGRYVLVDVYTDWCGWCKRMDSDVYARADVSGYLADKFVSIKLDAESEEVVHHQGHTMSATELARAFGVTGYPATLFLTPDGKLVTSLPGYLPPDRFLLVLRYIGDGHMERGVSFEDYEAQAGRS